MILCKSLIISVTNNAVTHQGQERKKKHAKEDNSRGQVRNVGEKRDKAFACGFVAYRMFTRLRCFILKIFFGILKNAR